jgi:hypothetical protein
MDELFRLTVSRPADRTNAATIPLERPTEFQEILQGIVSDPEPQKWVRMEQRATGFLESNLGWIASLYDETASTGDPALARALLRFRTDLRKALAASPPPTWPTAAENLMEPFKPTSVDLNAFGARLADVFLAYLFVRSSGPTRITSLVLENRIALAEFLRADRPSLNDLGDVLRLVHLVHQILIDPKQFSTESRVRSVFEQTFMLPPKIFAPLAKPVHAAGFSDLLVVKQHIHHYELGEIARIENILTGETRAHIQKHTLSNERETIFETETTTQTEEELTTTDHVSIRNEVESILKEDVKVEGGLHVQYDGGSYKIQSDLTAAYDRSSTESKKFASEVAKDITQKAAKRVSERLFQRARTRIVETFEENEEQRFENKSGPDVSGIYQWVTKVYLAQVFNYGKRLLFDLMLPEPAASLLAAAEAPSPQDDYPIPPDPLGTVLVDGTGQRALDKDGNKQLDKPLLPQHLALAPPGGPPQSFFGDWIAKFHVTGVEPPPPETITVAQSFSDDAKANNNVHIQGVLKIDDGYAASTFSVSVVWRTTSGNEDNSQIDVIVGERALFWKGGVPADTGTLNPASGSRNYGAQAVDVPIRVVNGQPVLLEQRSIGIALESTFTEEAAIVIEVRCVRTPELLAKWQLQAYDKIATQWKALWDDYQSKMLNLKGKEKRVALLGAAPPEINRQTERVELKRSALAILSHDRSLVDGQDAVVPLDDVAFDPNVDTAQEIGSRVRFFEQAFEWDKMSYVLYPYFWGRRSKWIDRLQLNHEDPLFENFLRAGYARIVIPVRKEFESAVAFFLLTGQPWLGGGLPSIGDKLYLPITEELKEQTGAPGNEQPVGDPWFVYLPTRLVKLRTGNEEKELPKWKRVPKDEIPSVGSWTWEVDDSTS